MLIIIKIKTKSIELILRRGEITIDKIIRENFNLSRNLLVEIDNILKRNNLKIGDLEKIDLKSSVCSQVTSVRVAKIVAKTVNCLKNVN